jgi:hypothetical protein
LGFPFFGLVRFSLHGVGPLNKSEVADFILGVFDKYGCTVWIQWIAIAVEFTSLIDECFKGGFSGSGR